MMDYEKHLRAVTKTYRAKKAASDKAREVQHPVVLEALGDGMSQRYIAEVTGIERATVNRWAQTARAQGDL